MKATVCFHDDPKPGDIVYLVEVCWVNTGKVRLDAHRKPQKTNMSGEERVEGWLGTTDNVDLRAIGRFHVVNVGPEGAYWQAGRKAELEALQ